MTARLATLLLLMSCAGAAMATELRHFLPGSMQTILDAHAGRPFVLSLWSQECSHCREELTLLSRMRRKYPTLGVVLVATDTPADAPALTRMMGAHRLRGADTWVFADPVPERLRFEIDRKWRGELPRTYLFDAHHQVEAVSGALPRARLERWIQAHVD